MSLVGRAFVEALKFGAPGGAILGAGFILQLDDAMTGPPRLSAEFIMSLLFGASVGVLLGLMTAYVALVLAGMSADIANRGVGVVVAFGVTFGAGFVVIWFLALGAAAYAAIVAWFRLPRIVGGGKLPVVE